MKLQNSQSAWLHRNELGATLMVATQLSPEMEEGKRLWQ